jgi:LacI family transcriptional regulator, repressor for deo operon, udp, cdd, tsx, nupC, and nupG
MPIAFLVIVYIKCRIKIAGVNRFQGATRKLRPQESLNNVKTERARRRGSRRPATIHDVAARAGVSTATVSRTLASPDQVSDEARARVLQAIKATGYTPNMAARNLRARRSMMVLVVVPNIANAFFAEILRGIDDELVENGYGIIIGNLDNRREREARYVDLVFARQVDAVLLMSGRIPAGNGRLMSEAGVPLATICVHISDSGFASVMVDDEFASRKVVDHLVGLGHRRFGYVSGPLENRNEIGRRGGFIAGLSAAGLDPGQAHYWQGDFMIGSGVGAAREFLALTERPTAVYAVSDSMAISFMKTVMEGGVRVPEDLSIVGFDGIDFSEFVTPTLTTIQQPRHEIGRTGARVLLEAIAKSAPPRSVKLAAPLIIRDSTAPPPKIHRKGEQARPRPKAFEKAGIR